MKRKKESDNQRRVVDIGLFQSETSSLILIFSKIVYSQTFVYLGFIFYIASFFIFYLDYKV
jgi:hypothetical protein